MREEAKVCPSARHYASFLRDVHNNLRVVGDLRGRHSARYHQMVQDYRAVARELGCRRAFEHALWSSHIGSAHPGRHEPRIHARAGEATDVERRQGTVLVVDDDPDIVDMVESVLGDQGFEVLAGLAGVALQVAHDRHPDVILLDLLMPGMDGVEVSRRLRDDPVTADIPIIAMSARQHLCESAEMLLANDLLSKPFHVGDLYAAVTHWAALSR